ncbi:MAG: type I glyceraldehyde-3-phosphate dehydrogenase [Candidatus Marinimicrobia bacterium]|jgi:glyceraldehyde 3-phosphate dehydrogenase|nr:type I glyceraldehyde-3-phosphate dehydrogenase [Candidatus Neomarinimicrobiota bacterium]MDP6853793.1 type I glyceraldehyde-3-phosphate dehydrogenase [Candidatus Neomarinimicrobiota bacterium]MDP6936265.1 type I glyceraldehyde-3-phosphate dehydrogenase [Candidatus Neomarinimicrobiota bacterium]
MRVAINGFGRIGRAVFRILNKRDNIKVIAINDLYDHHALAYLLKYDTVMGGFDEKVTLTNDGILETPSESVKMLQEKNPSDLPWSELDIDIVIESTGVFRTKETLQSHIPAGAKRVILTVPAKDEIDYTVVLGVNEAGLKPEHKIISNASCTTNCLAPMAKVLHEKFGIHSGVMNTIHAYTNDQRLADVPHKDWRRSRAAAENIIPTSTGAAKAVGKVLPELQGKLDGIASRVPVPDGSVVDLFLKLDSKVTVKEINQCVSEAANKREMKNILEYSEIPIVSSDIIGNPKSSIFDSLCTQVVNDHFVHTLNWYDNEWGYSNRVVDLIDKISTF